MTRASCWCVAVGALALASLVAVPTSAETGGQFAAPGIREPSDPDVNGVRFSVLYGKNDSVRGLDIGLLSISETKTLSGVGLVLGIGKVTGKMDGGAHFSLINIHTGRDSGLNAAFINKLNEADGAVDIGFVNIAAGETLLDIGGLNVSKSSTAQLGFINITDEIKGFQLGFINIAKNGFLPIFPFFNFAKDAGDK
jgi:hypothetical protein